MTKERYLLKKIANTWGLLEGGYHSKLTIENWLQKDMNPAIQQIRKHLSKQSKKEPSTKNKNEPMFYQERVIDGQLHYRTHPSGEWKKYSLETLTGMYKNLEKKYRELDQENDRRY